jgi:VIT1/CCC1 family predicted Fe2+/Mn2+ transporter
MLPLAAMALSTAELRIPITVAVGLVGLLITGFVSAAISGSSKIRPILRNIVGGSIAMLLTWSIGRLFGVGAS